MKDALGNDLKVGDMVAVQLERPLVFGQVVELSEGGVLVADGANMARRPGRVAIMSQHVIEFDPVQLVGAVLALRDDHARAAAIHSKAQGEMEKPN